MNKKINIKKILIFICLIILLILPLTKIPILILIGNVLPISFLFLYTTNTIKKKAKEKLKEYNSINNTFINKNINEETKNKINYSNELINNDTKQKVKVLKKTKV